MFIRTICLLASLVGCLGFEGEAQLVSLPSDTPNSSYSYLLSLARGQNTVPKPARNTPYSTVEAVGSLVRQEQNLLGNEDDKEPHSEEEEEQGYTSLAARPIVTRQQEASLPAQSRGVVEARVRPPSSSGVRRTSPHDIIGFSAVRASGFARVGESRIFFENTVTDSGYGWDRSLSLFMAHRPGLYFFTFSVKADADQGDNYKYEVSLVKNGDEVVSVGGAVNPSHRNSGTSASSSIVLQLVKDDRVWLQLLRGNLVETKNPRTGYTSFSGYRLGCSDTSDSGHHLEAVIIEDSDAEMEHEEPLPSLDSPGDGVTVDRTNWYRPDPPSSSSDRDRYSGQSQVYNDERLYDAFKYDKRPHEGDRRKNSQDDGNKPSSDRFDKDRYETKSKNKDRYETDRFDKDRYETDKLDKDRYETDRFDKDRYANKKYNKYDTHFPDRKPLDRYNTDRNSADRYSSDRQSINRYSTDRHSSDGYKTNPGKYPTDSVSTDRHTFGIYDADEPTIDKYWTDLGTRDKYTEDRFGGDRKNAKDRFSSNGHRSEKRPDPGAMFFLKREQSQKAPNTHVSYGK